MRLNDITSKKFGRLTILRKHVVPSKTGGSLWDCKCDCGNEVVRNASNLTTALKNGSLSSCGCFQDEWAKAWGANPAYSAAKSAAATKHGHKRRGMATAEYKTWLGMKRRCSDESYHDFANWGGRGIMVCDRWDKSFEAFFQDMGPRPSATHSIDRLNHNGHYEPGNCRWATPQQQGGENRRGLTPVTIDGVSYQSLKAACRASGIAYGVAYQRIAFGHDAEAAVTTPVRKLPNLRPRESYLPRNKR